MPEVDAPQGAFALADSVGDCSHAGMGVRRVEYPVGIDGVGVVVQVGVGEGRYDQCALRPQRIKQRVDGSVGSTLDFADGAQRAMDEQQAAPRHAERCEVSDDIVLRDFQWWHGWLRASV